MRDVGADRGSCVAGCPTALVQLFGVVAHEQQPVDVASKGDQLVRFACEEFARFARIQSSEQCGPTLRWPSGSQEATSVGHLEFVTRRCGRWSREAAIKFA